MMNYDIEEVSEMILTLDANIVLIMTICYFLLILLS